MSDMTEPAAAGSSDDTARDRRRLSFAAVLERLAESGARPPDDIAWPDTMLALSEHFFATSPMHSAPYVFSDAMREVFDLAADDDFVALGFDGHGVNSWAFHVIWRRGPVLVGFQVAAGGAYMNPAESNEALEGAWMILADIARDVRRVERLNFPAGRRLVAIDTDFGKSRWAWIPEGTGWESADWQETRFAAFEVMSLLQDL